MSAQHAAWRIRGNLALLECGPLRATVDLDAPKRGLSGIYWHNVQVLHNTPLQLLCGMDRCLESYVRGKDLVAIYESAGPQGFPQVYWRARGPTHNAAVGIEIVLSMRTDLLDALPLSAVDTLVGSGSLFHSLALDASSFVKLRHAELPRVFDTTDSRTHCFVMRDEQSRLAYAEFIHPSDFVSTTISAAGSVVECWHLKSLLFPDSLEKGVIRRARISGWFLPAENDLAIAVELAKQFLDEPLPLTT